MIEKPLAPTVAECRQILAAAEGRRRHADARPYHALHAAIPRGACGSSRRARSAGCGFGSSRDGSSSGWRRTAGEWHLDPERGGGMLFTAGIHALDRLDPRWPGGRATHVSAVIAAAFHDQKADDSALILIRFGDRAAGQVASIGYRDGAFISGDEIVCEKGVLRIDFFGGVEIGRGQRWEEVTGSFEDDIATRRWFASGRRSPKRSARDHRRRSAARTGCTWWPASRPPSAPPASAARSRWSSSARRMRRRRRVRFRRRAAGAACRGRRSASPSRGLAEEEVEEADTSRAARRRSRGTTTSCGCRRRRDDVGGGVELLGQHRREHVRRRRRCRRSPRARSIPALGIGGGGAARPSPASSGSSSSSIRPAAKVKKSRRWPGSCGFCASTRRSQDTKAAASRRSSTR